MAEYHLLVDGLLDNMIHSDKAVLKYGGFVLKEGVSFIQNGGMEKISSGIDSVNGILDKANETMGGIGQVIDSAAVNMDKAASLAKSAGSMIGTITPVITKAGPAVATAVSPVGLASSLGGNVQNAFIQKGVNDIKKSMKEMGVDVKRIDENVSAISSQVQDIYGAVSRMNNLSWVSAGASVLNCGISIAGFAVVINQLNDMKSQLNSIQSGISRIEQRLDKELIDRANVVLDNLMGYMQSLASQNFDMGSSITLWKDLNEAGRLIANLVDMAHAGTLKAPGILKLLLPLNISFEKVVKEYSIKAYYRDGSLPVNLTTWMQTLNLVGQAPLCRNINFYMHTEYPELSESEISSCMRYVRDDLMKAPVSELNNAIAFIEQTGISEQEYYDLPNMVMKRISERNFETVETMDLSEVYTL